VDGPLAGPCAGRRPYRPRWIGRFYLALWSAAAGGAPVDRFAKGKPLNHIGVEVEDLDATEARVIAAGLTPFSHGEYEPGRRFYFFDPDGIEFEVVSYSPARAIAAAQ
jgi:catechol 2,3-dioxygenase-like lactoylglutathione lyase family enzyme